MCDEVRTLIHLNRKHDNCPEHTIECNPPASRNDDFFAVKRFPTASFRLTGWEVQEGASPEAPNGIDTGNLTIRDVSRPISFPAIVAPQTDGGVKAHSSAWSCSFWPDSPDCGTMPTGNPMSIDDVTLKDFVRPVYLPYLHAILDP